MWFDCLLGHAHHAHHALVGAALARDHYRQALTLYTELGTPQADQIRARLTAVDLEQR